MSKHPASVTGTFANRMIHTPSLQAIIGHWVRIRVDCTCKTKVQFFYN